MVSFVRPWLPLGPESCAAVFGLIKLNPTCSGRAIPVATRGQHPGGGRELVDGPAAHKAVDKARGTATEAGAGTGLALWRCARPPAELRLPVVGDPPCAVA